jgi:SAM-dependent methyltransferase
MVSPVADLRRGQGAQLLFETLEGPIRFALLDHAMKTGLFDLCAAPVGAAELAQAQGLDAGRLALVLRALVACGFLERMGEAFRTPPDLLPLLSAQSPTSLIPSLQALARLRHAGLDRIADLLAPVRPEPERPLFDAAYWNRAHDSLASFHRGAAAQVMVPLLTALPEWAGAQSLLEIGPGSGTLARALSTLRPGVQITLLDLPPVAGRISDELADLAVRVLPGSYNEPLPAGAFDLIFASMTLYFHDRGIAPLIGRIAERLAPGGVLVSLHATLTEGRCAPAEHVIGRLMPALWQRDVSFDDGEIAGAMERAGLVVRSNWIGTPFGRFRVDTARKPLPFPEPEAPQA